MLHLVLVVALVVVLLAVIDHVVLEGAVVAKVKALLITEEAVVKTVITDSIDDVKKDL